MMFLMKDMKIDQILYLFENRNDRHDLAIV